jgi:hypothetical protein
MRLTPLLLAVFPIWLSTTPALAALGDDGRPILSGPELTHLSADGLFKVHYTLSGGDALAVTDDNDPKNGVPDSVDWIEEGVARMHQAYVLGDGWPEPPNDEGVGGDNRTDIYVRALDINGYTHYVQLPSGDYASYIEVAPGNARLSKGTFESIAGHEYHHVLQFGMTDRASAWIYEATATYAQYDVFNDDAILALARQALWLERLGEPELGLTATGNRYEYAGMIWVKYLIDKGKHDRQKLLSLWQAMAFAKNAIAGHEAFVKTELGLPSLDAAVEDYAVWNWFACKNDDGQHYDPNTLPCLAGTVNALDVKTLPADGQSVTIGPRGSYYLHLVRDCKTDELDVTVRPTGTMNLQVIYDLPQTNSTVTSKDAPANVDTALAVNGWNDAHQIALVATNLATAPATFSYHASARGTYAPTANLPKPATLVLGPDVTDLDVGQTASISLAGTFGTCADGADLTGKAKFTFSDPTIVRIDGTKVTALRRGTTDIFAVVDGVGSNHIAVRVRASLDSGSCQIGNGAPGALPNAVWVVGILLAQRVRRRWSRRHPV